jgi:hypothetical protein
MLHNVPLHNLLESKRKMKVDDTHSKLPECFSCLQNIIGSDLSECRQKPQTIPIPEPKNFDNRSHKWSYFIRQIYVITNIYKYFPAFKKHLGSKQFFSIFKSVFSSKCLLVFSVAIIGQRSYWKQNTCHLGHPQYTDDPDESAMCLITLYVSLIRLG